MAYPNITPANYDSNQTLTQKYLLGLTPYQVQFIPKNIGGNANSK